MDLWDLTTLMVRRWYFALPLLLVSVSAVLVAAQGVKPDYKALGHLQLIPPPGLGKVDPAKPRPNNPWLDLGYNALGNAAVLKVTGDQSSLEDLKNSGFSDSVTVTMNERSPLLEIEVVGDSPQQATATVKEVIRRLNVDIADEQAQYNVERIDVITSLTLSDGSHVEVVTSKVKRVLVVAAGLGLLVTIAGTVAIDALLRRRWRKKRGLHGAPAGQPAPANGSALLRRDGGMYPMPTANPVLMLPAATVGRPATSRQFNSDNVYGSGVTDSGRASVERTQWLDADSTLAGVMNPDAPNPEDSDAPNADGSDAGGANVNGAELNRGNAGVADNGVDSQDDSSVSRHDSTIVLPLQLSLPDSRKKRRR